MRLRHIPREASRLVRHAVGLKKEEIEELSQITAHLEPSDTFVDIGAHEGKFSLLAGNKVGPRGVVLAIEPNPDVLEKLRLNVAASGLQNIQVEPVAVGDEEGEATLHLFKQHTDPAFTRTAVPIATRYKRPTRPVPSPFQSGRFYPFLPHIGSRRFMR